MCYILICAVWCLKTFRRTDPWQPVQHFKKPSQTSEKKTTPDLQYDETILSHPDIHRYKPLLQNVTTRKTSFELCTDNTTWRHAAASERKDFSKACTVEYTHAWSSSSQHMMGNKLHAFNYLLKAGEPVSENGPSTKTNLYSSKRREESERALERLKEPWRLRAEQWKFSCWLQKTTETVFRNPLSKSRLAHKCLKANTHKLKVLISWGLSGGTNTFQPLA